jgi:all-trans-retinol dehydrogenase (NAD+)
MPEQSFLEKATEVAVAVLSGLQVLATVVFLTIRGAVKACLPQGVLPRKSVQGELVLITGAGHGFGRLLALRFAKLGARLVLWDINEKTVDETAKECRGFGATVYTYKVDLSDKDDTYRVGKRTIEEAGNVDILINNAGVVTGRSLIDCGDEQIMRTMTINAISHMWTVKIFLPSMMQRNHGHIVSVASAAGMLGCPYLVDYCSSKFAAMGLAQSLFLELAANGLDGIKMTTICPTFMDTGMFAGVGNMAAMPVMSPESCADASIDAILTDRTLLCLPKIVYVLVFLSSFMPVEAMLYIGKKVGALNAMDNFKNAT